jgi:hypothetical protein
MTKREVAALACRLLGIYAFLNSLNALPVVFLPFITEYSDATAAGGLGSMARFWLFILNALPAALHIIAGLYLWLNADSLAGYLVSGDTDEQQMAIGQEAQVIAFSVLGLFTLLQVIPRIGQIITNLVVIGQQDPLMQRDFRGTTAPDIVSIIIQLALGLWLLFGSPGLVQWLRPMRTRDMDQEDVEGTQGV